MEVKDDRIPSSPASPSSKKSSRRCLLKRVVSVPAAEVDGGRTKGGGDAAPPSDSWAWRKYGQKPIKGSPYPRGYYRCSSSKGCPARKQVERSRVDPTTFTVTYSLDHDHTLPFHKNHHHHRREPTVAGAPAAALQRPKFQEVGIPDASPASDPEKACDPTVEDPAGIMLPDDFPWFAEVGSPSGTSGSDAGFFGGPILRVADASVFLFDDCDEFSGGGAEEEEDGLFAGLGDLPECSIVLRRGFLERQWRGRGGDRKRCAIEAEQSASTPSPWCGRTS